MITIVDAIMELDKTAEVTLIEDNISTLEWFSAPIIANDIIIAKQAEMQAEYDSQEYARNRRIEYEQLNQFEMQFDDQRDGTSTWVDTINAIKDKYPKE